MKCPKCSQEMEVKNEDTSHNPENEKEYNRTLYHCKYCDIWINVEIPKSKIHFVHRVAG